MNEPVAALSAYNIPFFVLKTIPFLCRNLPSSCFKSP